MEKLLDTSKKDRDQIRFEMSQQMFEYDKAQNQKIRTIYEDLCTQIEYLKKGAESLLEIPKGNFNN